MNQNTQVVQYVMPTNKLVNLFWELNFLAYSWRERGTILTVCQQFENSYTSLHGN